MKKKKDIEIKILSLPFTIARISYFCPKIIKYVYILNQCNTLEWNTLICIECVCSLCLHSDAEGKKENIFPRMWGKKLIFYTLPLIKGCEEKNLKC